MFSVKPGVVPLMSGFMGIVVIIGGIIWTGVASSMGAPSFFIAFGVLFVIMAIAMVIYNFYNATQPNRMSIFDITRAGEEPDPLNKWAESNPSSSVPSSEPSVNPRKYEGISVLCGALVEDNFDYCPNCGKDI